MIVAVLVLIPASAFQALVVGRLDSTLSLTLALRCCVVDFGPAFLDHNLARRGNLASLRKRKHFVETSIASCWVKFLYD